MKNPTLLLSLLTSTGLAGSALAEIPVFSGDDLAALVASAPDGEVLTIQSSDTFVSTLSWSGKSLTIQAAPGFTPTIQGAGTLPAVSLAANGTSSVGARFSGLRLSTTGATAVALAGGSLGQSVTVAFEDCIAQGNIVQSGFGDIAFDVELRRTEVQGYCFMTGSGNTSLDFRVVEGSQVSDLFLFPLSSSTATVLVEDSRSDNGFTTEAMDEAALDATLRRARFDGSSYIRTPEDSGSTTVLLESCLMAGPGQGRGLSVEPGVDVRGVNLTIFGFSTGLEAAQPSRFENLVVAGSITADIAATMDPDQIANSLIEDGTFAGSQGNFQGVPELDADYALVVGSPGVDAGNSSAADLGTLDLYGSDRIQDGDSNGLPQVSVGAVESTPPAIMAAFTPINGSGTNPTLYDVLQPPALGSDLIATISTGPNTLLTVLAIGTEATTPLFLPGVLGEVLLSPANKIRFDTALGSHTVPVPSWPELYGKPLASQALTLEMAGSTVETLAANGTLLTLGAL